MNVRNQLEKVTPKITRRMRHSRTPRRWSYRHTKLKAIGRVRTHTLHDLPAVNERK